MGVDDKKYVTGFPLLCAENIRPIQKTVPLTPTKKKKETLL